MPLESIGRRVASAALPALRARLSLVPTSVLAGYALSIFRFRGSRIFLLLFLGTVFS